MTLALREARKGIGLTSPNPAVGAVITTPDRTLLSTGWHRAAGQPHAEVEALRALPDPALARGATLYVTLEPCSTHGRTPPCVEAILRAGIGKVVIGTLDPNPAHAGRAISLLEAAGVKVEHGVLETECRELNKAFNHWIVTGMPWIIAKAGLSLDGRLTRPPTDPRWITNALSRQATHGERLRVDAILVGGETVRNDNPRLTARDAEGRELARQPWRVVVSRSGNLPADAALFTDAWKDRTLVFTDQPLRQTLSELGQRQITSVLIEGGMRTLGEAFDEGLVHEVSFYIAPLLTGGSKVVIGGLGTSGLRIPSPRITRLGDDLHLSGDLLPARPPAPPAGAPDGVPA